MIIKDVSQRVETSWQQKDKRQKIWKKEKKKKEYFSIRVSMAGHVIRLPFALNSRNSNTKMCWFHLSIKLFFF